MSPPTYATAIRFVKFGIASTSGTLVNTFVLWIGHRLVLLPLAAASPAALIVTILNNFLINERWTWRHKPVAGKGDFWNRLARFYISSSTGACVNFILLLILSKALGVHYLAANIAGGTVGSLVNFYISDRWVFR